MSDFYNQNFNPTRLLQIIDRDVIIKSLRAHQKT